LAGGVAAWYGFQWPDADRILGARLSWLDYWLFTGRRPAYPSLLVFFVGVFLAVLLAAGIELALRRQRQK
jgi:hypothetical protein